ncbi:hypothetical protein P6P90_01440 [Ectobacillus antri]|jgi:hypothetical protein|uniref:Uncharacterized protein n=1 Tax=Ectobacillus antri TaxID=2486280 RepID=A0ABT6H123_9BACI|nr:hypothetical protein [Ectobacillus antri]MDG4655990.1 hypothetical protein [Ectobacillus antri]MDG5752665.1 hypothetical protein [Ectobacillus antri]
MKTELRHERVQALLDEMIVDISTNSPHVSKEELDFSLLCLMRACQGILDEEQNWDYIESKFNAAYNLLTGRAVYPF